MKPPQNELLQDFAKPSLKNDPQEVFHKTNPQNKATPRKWISFGTLYAFCLGITSSKI